ncbi:MAG: hypothetical protein KDK55_01635 [Chlamydiia bacterium]|nr:hypothetical protein [Chlamydiia bacterium]
MDQKGGAFFSTLLVQLPFELRKRTLACLPKETLSVLCEIEEPIVKERFPTILTSGGWLHKIHYSWFHEALKGFSPRALSHFVALFPPERKKKLEILLGISPKNFSNSPFSSYFLLAKLKKRIVPKTIISEEILSPHPLNELLALSKEHLTSLINLIGVHDVIYEIKKIVDKTLLEKIYYALLPKQLAFLKKYSNRQIRWSPPPLSLQQWNGEKKTLLNTIHDRGLIRFSYALYEVDKNLIWHITHILDTGRAKKILSHIGKIPNKQLVSYFRKQVLEAKKEISS